MSIAPVSYLAYGPQFDHFAAELGASFERYGFAVISDHGLDQALLDEVQGAAQAFFALPLETKIAYRIEGGGGQRGYTPFGVETAKGAEHHDLKEFWHVGRPLPKDHAYRSVMPDNVWPAEAPTFKPAALKLYSALDALGETILRAIARRLGLEDAYFETPIRDGNSILRLLHYPPTVGAGPHVRAGAHEDINAITLLVGAEEAGLQIRERSGVWLDVNPPRGSIVCNIGDMLQRLTNHKLPSTTHRVVNPAPERQGVARYSMPFFLHFAPDFLIQTLPQCIDADHPDHHPTPITAQAFLEERLREIHLA